MKNFDNTDAENVAMIFQDHISDVFMRKQDFLIGNITKEEWEWYEKHIKYLKELQVHLHELLNKDLEEGRKVKNKTS